MTPLPTGGPGGPGPQTTATGIPARDVPSAGGKGDATPPPPTLAPGTTITARIAGQAGPHAFSLELADGSRLTARSDIELTPGATMRLTVLQAGPPPLLTPQPENDTLRVQAGEFLRLLDPGPGPSLLQRLAALQGFFSGDRAMPPLDHLAALLSSLALEGEPAPARLMASALLFLLAEGGLRTLIPGLAPGGHLFSRLRAAAPARLQDDIDHLERFLRLNDLLASHRPAWLALPLLFTGQDRGWLLAEPRPAPDATASLVLLLDLSRLGPLRASLLAEGDRLALTFTTPAEAVRDHLRGRLHELEAGIAARHGGRLSLAVTTGPVNLPADAKQILERKLAEPDISLVDIRV